LPPEAEPKERPTLSRKAAGQASQERARRAEVERANRQREEEELAAARAAHAARPAPPPDRTRLFVLIGTIAVLGLLAIPAYVYTRRSAATAEEMQQWSQSGQTMLCTEGQVGAADASGLWAWLFGGDKFRCTDWETLETRKEREKARAAERAAEFERRRHAAELGQ